MPGRRSLVGKQFGDFKVIEMLYQYNNTKRTYCRCIGIDEKEYIIRADALVSGVTKTIKNACREKGKKDLTGKRFGMLTVLYDTGKRRNPGGHVIWHCRCDCGNCIDVLSHHLVSSHTMSCGCKKSSKWEELIADYLKNNNINFITQKRFSDCKNKKGSDMLPFDFYIPELNKIIEYDGQHHFEPVNGWGGEEKFKLTVENDNIKNEYCKNNDIDLLRIPYTYKKEDVIKAINDFINL